MTKEFKAFQRQFNRAIAGVEADLEEVIRATGVKLFSEIVLRTPVDTGRLRGNWRPSINTPFNGYITSTDKTGASTINHIHSASMKFNLGDTFYLTNNLEYARYVEEGTPKMRPSAMVKGALRSATLELKKQAKKKGF